MVGMSLEIQKCKLKYMYINTRNTQEYDALRRVNASGVYVDRAYGWGARSKCQKLCIAGLVRANRNIPGL